MTSRPLADVAERRNLTALLADRAQRRHGLSTARLIGEQAGPAFGRVADCRDALRDVDAQIQRRIALDAMPLDVVQARVCEHPRDAFCQVCFELLFAERFDGKRFDETAVWQLLGANQADSRPHAPATSSLLDPYEAGAVPRCRSCGTMACCAARAEEMLAPARNLACNHRSPAYCCRLCLARLVTFDGQKNAKEIASLLQQWAHDWV